MHPGFILLALYVFIFWRSAELEPVRYTACFGLLLFSLIPGLLASFSFMPKAVKKNISSVICLGGRLKLVKKPEETVPLSWDKLMPMVLDRYQTVIDRYGRTR